MVPIIRGCRYKDTRTNKKKILIKTLGEYLYFSDDTKVSEGDFNEYFEVVNANED